MDVATRSADWLGEVVDLMREPSCAVPVPALLTLLQDAFGTWTSGWNWFDPDGSFGMMIDPPDVPRNERETLDFWQTGELFDAHPLLRWYERTGDFKPQSMARVPTSIISRRRRLLVERPLAGMGMTHQLSIVYRQAGSVHRAFIVSRDGSDFADDDLAVARVVQRSLAALDHQVAVMQRVKGARTGTDLGLTGRQLAVLQLIAEGAAPRRVARVLGCSPRTVEKHLQNAYRRLEVSDRLNAVRVLQVAGVLGTPPVPDHRAVLGPGAYRGRVPRVSAVTAALVGPVGRSRDYAALRSPSA